MVTRKTIYIALAAVLAVVCPKLIAQTQGLEDADQWGRAFDGVQLALSLDPHPSENSSTPALRIAIRNIGMSPRLVVLGSGCGDVNSTNNITLDVTDDLGQKREFRDRTANLPCGGRLVAYKVALPPGGDFSTPLLLQEYGYISPVTHRFEKGFQRGGSYAMSAAIPFDASVGFDVPYLIPLANSPSGASTTYEVPYQIPIAHVPERLTSNELRIDVPAQH